MSDRWLVQITPKTNVAQILDYVVGKPGQVAIKEIATNTGLTESNIRATVRGMKRWYANLNVRITDSSVFMSYRPIMDAPETVVIAQTQTQAPATGKAKANGKTVEKTAQQPQAATTKTEVVWASPPPIPDLEERYGFFVKPQWFDRLQSKIIVHHRNVRLKGPPGIGKSVAVEVLAAKNFQYLVNIGAEAGLRARQLIGGMSDLGRFEVAEFATAVVKGWWAKVDEANGADPDAILFLNGVTAPPYMITINGKTYPVHPNFRLVITYNPNLIGTKPLPESLKDRFYPFNIGFPSKAQLETMLKGHNLDPGKKEVALLIDYAMKIAKLRQDGKCRFDVTLRRILDAWTDIEDGYTVKDAMLQSCVDGIDNAMDALVVQNVLNS